MRNGFADDVCMSRKARVCPPATFQHVISEFVDREFWLADALDRSFYLSSVSKRVENYAGLLLAYALMSSHIHWGLLTGPHPLERLFRSVHTRYAAYWHRRHGGRGPIFANRPANFQVRPHTLCTLVAYIHMNPVRCRACHRPADSDWTSHRAYLRLAPAPPWLDVQRALDLCGFQDTEAGRRAFDEFVQSCDTRHWEADQSVGSVGPQTVELEALVSAGPKTTGWAELVESVSRLSGITPQNLFNSSDRRRHVSSARRILVHIARDQYGLGASQIAKKLCMTESSVRYLALQDLSVEHRRFAARLL